MEAIDYSDTNYPTFMPETYIHDAASILIKMGEILASLLMISTILVNFV